MAPGEVNYNRDTYILSTFGGVPMEIDRKLSAAELVWVEGIPAWYTGPRAVASYSALVRYFSCEDGGDNAPATQIQGEGIRRIEVG